MPITLEDLHKQEEYIRNLSVDAKKQLWTYKKLSDFSEGTTFVFKSYSTQQNQKGDTLLFVEFDIRNTETDIYTTDTLSLPARFFNKCAENMPCIAVYMGKAESHAGRSYYDLKFLNNDHLNMEV